MTIDRGAERAEVSDYDALVYVARALLRIIKSPESRKKYFVAVGDPNRSSSNGSLFIPGKDHFEFGFGPDTRIAECRFRVYGFGSDIAELVAAAMVAVKRKKDAGFVASLFARDTAGSYDTVTVQSLNNAVFTEAAELNYLERESFARSPQDVGGLEGRVFLDVSEEVVEGTSLPRCFRLRFGRTTKNLLFGLGNVNEIYDILRFVDLIRGVDLSKKSVEHKLSGSRVLVATPDVITLNHLVGQNRVPICNFSVYQWNQFVLSLRGVHEGYGWFIDSLIRSN